MLQNGRDGCCVLVLGGRLGRGAGGLLPCGIVGGLCGPHETTLDGVLIWRHIWVADALFVFGLAGDGDILVREDIGLQGLIRLTVSWGFVDLLEYDIGRIPLFPRVNSEHRPLLILGG